MSRLIYFGNRHSVVDSNRQLTDKSKRKLIGIVNVGVATRINIQKESKKNLEKFSQTVI